ncbi:hypothetical protein Q8G35_24375 [Peribacillus simplex]|uniref:Uncharacterized protein n=2 Tax=Peribacillus TaxID=2675229 RepID=A0AA90T3B7_9BACI|nr:MULTISPECIES: hypothetical protein [Peribacillus]MDP1421421.1 hypothetical protein [Peribacillus simplex]MDP1454199.1 hypothetical protein [Peribacillus frigoritolerans]
MDKEQGKRMVKRFFAKRIQDRVIFELSSERKRVEALNRLCTIMPNTYSRIYD